MRWLIDGNNVMGARPDGWWRDRAGAAARLTRRIDAWQQRTGDEVVVVFDGRPQPELAAAARPGFAVRFAPGPGGADELIAVLAGAGPDSAPEAPTPAEPAAGRSDGAAALGSAQASAATTTVVVTSDAGLAARLPREVAVRGAGSFRRELDEIDVPEP